MKNLQIQIDQENVNYFVIIDDEGNFVKNETGNKHMFSSYDAARDVKFALLGVNVPGSAAIKSIFSL